MFGFFKRKALKKEPLIYTKNWHLAGYMKATVSG